LQQQRRQQQYPFDLDSSRESLMLDTSQLLLMQMRAVLQAGSSGCLPPEVLQQAGLQLLQALAALLQQLQLAHPGSSSVAGLPDAWGNHVSQQLLALRAAGAGLASMQAGDAGEHCCCCCCCCCSFCVLLISCMMVRQQLFVVPGPGYHSMMQCAEGCWSGHGFYAV